MILSQAGLVGVCLLALVWLLLVDTFGGAHLYRGSLTGHSNGLCSDGLGGAMRHWTVGLVLTTLEFGMLLF